MRTTVLTMMLLVAVMSLYRVAVQAQPAPGQTILRGKVLEAGRKQARILLYYRARSKDAPGKVPDEMAQQAAALTEKAKRLEQQGKAEEARKLWRMVDELLCWREIEVPLAEGDNAELTGLYRVGFDKIEEGMRVRVNVSTREQVPAGAVPKRAALTRDIFQLTDNARDMLRRLPDVPNVRSSFFEMVGEVVDTDPLTLKVEGKEVELETPAQYSFVQRRAIALRDLQAGQSVFAHVAPGRGQQPPVIRRMVALFFRPDGPLGPEDIGE